MGPTCHRDKKNTDHVVAAVVGGLDETGALELCERCDTMTCHLLATIGQARASARWRGRVRRSSGRWGVQVLAGRSSEGDGVEPSGGDGIGGGSSDGQGSEACHPVDVRDPGNHVCGVPV
jgi:hypothetical protein